MEYPVCLAMVRGQEMVQWLLHLEPVFSEAVQCVRASAVPESRAPYPVFQVA